MTSSATISADARFRASMNCREPIVVAGLEIAIAFFRALDPDVEIEKLTEDGEAVTSGTVLLRLDGKARDMLTAERSALNTLQHLSGVATLTHATAEVYDFVDARSLELSGALSAALDAAGVDHSIQRAGNLFSVAFGTSARGVHNYDDAQGQEVFRYAPFFHSMLDSGVYLPPSVFEAWFLSAAHDDAAMNRIFDALPAAARAAAAARA